MQEIYDVLIEMLAWLQGAACGVGCFGTLCAFLLIGVRSAVRDLRTEMRNSRTGGIEP